MHNPNYGETPATSAPPPAPPAAPVPPNLYRESQMIGTVWSTGLCDFAEDFTGCCITCWCPCITFGRVSEIVDRGSSSCGMNGALYTLILVLTGCQWIYSWFYRAKLRTLYGLPESPCCDCCVHMLCEPCALCQEYRELKNRGFDMAIGWNRNAERHAGAGGRTTQPPATQGDMTR